ncbi:hypothetical protein FRC19_004869 [Serendipita sp. 401]|nr:hypothetical protein FRC16_010380 [Serendipita sp. 398]KAG8809981.1 hypothetical protein FRC19_004869 [Serendipita sp. 401]KAG8846212.1 hypothetical protein FRC20_003031 [Serendipita sp. 405]
MEWKRGRGGTYKKAPGLETNKTLIKERKEEKKERIRSRGIKRKKQKGKSAEKVRHIYPSSLSLFPISPNEPRLSSTVLFCTHYIVLSCVSWLLGGQSLGTRRAVSPPAEQEKG